MARRTTSKTGKSRSATSSDESRSPAATDTPEGATPPVAAPEPGPDPSPAPDSAAEQPVDMADATPVPLSDGPAQMGEDTAQAPDQTAQDMAEPDSRASLSASAPGPTDDQTAAPADGPVNVQPPQDMPAPETPPIAPPPATPAPQPRGGFLPLVLGGVVAAALGYGAHYLQSRDQTAPDMTQQIQADLAQLRANIAEGPDLSDVQAQVTALSSDTGSLDAALNDMRGQIAALPDPGTLQAQIDALRNAPEPEVDFTPLQAEIARLDAAIATLRDEMAALRTLSTERVTAAEAAVNTARATAALDRIEAALVTGAPFADALQEVNQAGVTPPTALGAAADGVQTLEALQNSFDAAARDAIAASLQAAPADSTSERLGNFLRAQIGARSLAPRDGDDADAITARAGVAVADGDLATAATELNALPDAGRSAMGGWLDALDTRLNAQAALADLRAQLTTE